MSVDADDRERDDDAKDLSDFRKEIPPIMIEPEDFVDDVRELA